MANFFFPDLREDFRHFKMVDGRFQDGTLIRAKGPISFVANIARHLAKFCSGEHARIDEMPHKLAKQETANFASVLGQLITFPVVTAPPTVTDAGVESIRLGGGLAL